MLKKKRFSGLFGSSMTDIPSPGQDQTSITFNSSQPSVSGSFTSAQAYSPQTFAAQGRQQSFGVLPMTNSPGPGLNSSPANISSAITDEDASSLTRAEVHQSLENLKKLVIAAESYRELTTKLAKTTKQLSRCLKDFCDSKGMDSTYVMCLKSSANFYESYSEMESKLASCLQKDFELLQGNWEKHSKRVTKDERAHDEILGDLDDRIKKMSQGYDKKSKKPDPNTALMSHEKYISTLSELQDSIAVAKRDHRNTVARRERYTHSLTAQVACRLAEAQFLAIERQLRGTGPSLLKIKEWAPYAGQDMLPPTLVTDGEPTIVVRGGTFEEYTARHSAPTQPVVPGTQRTETSSMPSADTGGNVFTLTEMPQVTLPPFAPMQQLRQQQQQQQQQQPQQQQPQQQQQQQPQQPQQQQQQQRQQQQQSQVLPPTSPMAMPMPTQMPAPAPVSTLPTAMPEPKNYIPISKQSTMPVSQISTPLPTRQENLLLQSGRPEIVKAEPRVLVKDTKMVVAAPIIVTDLNIKVEKDSTPKVRTTIVPLTTKSVITTSPPNTPGAFPVSDVLTTRESVATVAETEIGKRIGATRTEVFEDQGSVSTKVGSADEGSNQGDHLHSKMDLLRKKEGQILTAADDALDAATLDRYRREQQQERYRYQEQDSMMYEESRLDARNDFSMRRRDDMYDDIYSPVTDEHPYYDDEDDRDHLEPRMYPDDDDSEHSGSVPIRAGRGEYYNGARYEERDYNRSYQPYSSSVPTRNHRHDEQLQGFQHEREMDRVEWSDSVSMIRTNGAIDFTREQYPTSRGFSARPTLDDRERELELRNQKIASSLQSTSRPTYGHRPESASGTVAHLRRRFSDQSVSDITLQPGAIQLQAGSRPRGTSGSGQGLQQPHQQLESGRRDRDPRFPPRASTPQSRLVAASTGSRYDLGTAKGIAAVPNSNGAPRVQARYVRGMSDHEDNAPSRQSVGTRR